MSRRDCHLRSKLALLSLVIGACFTALGCFGTDDARIASLEATEIVELISESREVSNTRGDVEVDLGKYRVTHAVGDEEEALLLVDFQLVAVLAGQKQAALEAELPAYG